MNDDLMLEYLLQMGSMQPEQQELKRRQAQIDALRQNAMQPLQGQMIGKHYVAPSMVQGLAQLGQAAMAGYGQQGVNQSIQDMNNRQRQALEELRKRKAMGMAQTTVPSGLFGAGEIGDY